jgi:tetratricopeptide (TPR) repeat protein
MLNESPSAVRISVAENKPSRETIATTSVSLSAGHPGLPYAAPVGRAYAVPQMAPAPPRAPPLEGFVRQADEHYRQGFDLANRGAYFSARAEFIESLRRIVQGLDAETGGNAYSQALAAGMLALTEADDFAPRGSRVDGNVHFGDMIQAHTTPVRKDLSVESLSPTSIQERYYLFAAEQLAAAVGSAPSGSRALHALGKIYGILASQKSSAISSAGSQAAVFHQAALRADPANITAANDLAVLLATDGRYWDARDLLCRGLSISSQPAMWHNLSVVHAQLGEAQLAERAQRAALVAGQGTVPATNPAAAAWQSVRWVDPRTFAGAAQPATDMRPVAAARPAMTAPPPAERNTRSAGRPWSRSSPANIWLQ